MGVSLSAITFGYVRMDQQRLRAIYVFDWKFWKWDNDPFFEIFGEKKDFLKLFIFLKNVIFYLFIYFILDHICTANMIRFI